MIIYQVVPRLFGNDNAKRKKNGTLQQNGSGRLSSFTPNCLRAIKKLGVTHIWFTGILEHATATAHEQIEADVPSVVKGIAGSPYAVRDYYDIDADLVEQPANRIEEFEALVRRTHRAGLGAIIDFVPNHVARTYRSDMKPDGVRDFGEADRKELGFSPQNNFYYFPNTPFAPRFDLGNYTECPAKATGNDCFSPSPSVNDWYETVKLNYGVDYMGGGAHHFDPMPDTWLKMRDILLYWAAKGVDGFRCDMAEMVPVEFWHWVIAEVKAIPATVFRSGGVQSVALSCVYTRGRLRLSLRQGRTLRYVARRHLRLPFGKRNNLRMAVGKRHSGAHVVVFGKPRRATHRFRLFCRQCTAGYPCNDGGNTAHGFALDVLFRAGTWRIRNGRRGIQRTRRAYNHFRLLEP